MGGEQAYTSSYAPRLRQFGNAFIAPVTQTQAITLAPRTTKRGTAIKNYADDADDDDFDDDTDSQRRHTGLRTLRQQEQEKKEPQFDKLGKEIAEPVRLQGIYREWMMRRTVKPTYGSWITQCCPGKTIYEKLAYPLGWFRTDQQVHIQAQLPLTMIPIRIDLDIPAHTPDPPFPVPRGLDPAATLEPQFRRPEPVPAYKLRDVFLWNLHETLLTPDDFALNLVRDLDLPNLTGLALAIAQQIREQLMEYAGVALHPLFHSQPKAKPQEPTTNGVANGASASSRDGTPRPSVGFGATSRGVSTTPNPSTPAASTPHTYNLPNGAVVTAHASPLPAGEPELAEQQEIPPNPFLNPDDTYRCIITLSISLSSRLYTDKFEWSLLHPPGAAETFAQQTCADMGLNGEWVLAITHAIYEAVLRLKKEACEGGMMITASGLPGLWGQGEVDNQAVNGEEGAGWRYDADDFGAEWEPKLEELSKEEIEKREGDRERQLRRVRRDTAKFSSTTGMAPSQREREAEVRGSYFDSFSFAQNSLNQAGGGAGDETPGMGRGERSKKKRRFRSLSPVARAIGAGTPEAAAGVNGVGAGWGGDAGKLSDYERQNWRCRWCCVWGSAAWALRDGPQGVRVSLFFFASLRNPFGSAGFTDCATDAVQ